MCVTLINNMQYNQIIDLQKFMINYENFELKNLFHFVDLKQYEINFTLHIRNVTFHYWCIINTHKKQ